MMDQTLVNSALKSGNFKSKNIWTEMYLRFRSQNIYLYVRKELSDEYIQHIIEQIKSLELIVGHYNHKKCVGAYLLSLICAPPSPNFFVTNPTNTIIYRKI